jgi:hypothetical protein
MGWFLVAWSNVIAFVRLVVGRRVAEAEAVTATFALEPAESFVALDGVPAKPSIARRTPTEQRAKANKTRGLKRPD